MDQRHDRHQGLIQEQGIGRGDRLPYLATSDECGYTEIRRAAGADKLSFPAEEQCMYCVFLRLTTDEVDEIR
jgi:hypothetical protein